MLNEISNVGKQIRNEEGSFCFFLWDVQMVVRAIAPMAFEEAVGIM